MAKTLLEYSGCSSPLAGKNVVRN